MYQLYQDTIKITNNHNTYGSKLIKLSIQFSLKLFQVVVEKVWELLNEKKTSHKLYNLAKDSLWKPLKMIELLSKSLLLDLAIFKFKFLEINSRIMFTFLSVIVQFKEDIKKLFKKLPQIYPNLYVNQFANQLLMRLKQLDITMQELLNSYSI